MAQIWMGAPDFRILITAGEKWRALLEKNIPFIYKLKVKATKFLHSTY